MGLRSNIGVNPEQNKQYRLVAIWLRALSETPGAQRQYANRRGLALIVVKGLLRT